MVCKMTFFNFLFCVFLKILPIKLKTKKKFYSLLCFLKREKVYSILVLEY